MNPKNILNFRILAQAILSLSRQGFSIIIVAKSKKGHNSMNVLQNSLKSYSGHLNINSKLSATYQNPSSSSSQDIFLTKIFYCYNSKVVIGA